MENDRIKRLRRGLRRQVQWGQNLFLAIIAVSLVNQLMLWMRVEYHFLFSAAMPYYLNWLAFQLPNTALKVVAVIATLALYAVYAGCWFFFWRREWLTAAISLYAVDTVLLIVMAFVLLGNPLSCLLEILIHALALVVLLPSRKACLRLEQLSRQAESQKERFT